MRPLSSPVYKNDILPKQNTLAQQQLPEILRDTRELERDRHENHTERDGSADTKLRDQDIREGAHGKAKSDRAPCDVAELSLREVPEWRVRLLAVGVNEDAASDT
jgi:hypothetical protein